MLSSYFTRDWASENDSIQDEMIPIELSHLPWDSHGDIDITMEEARWRELPILAVFSNWFKPEAWRNFFRDSDVLAPWTAHNFLVAAIMDSVVIIIISTFYDNTICADNNAKIITSW